jgi:hypothetical protein
MPPPPERTNSTPVKNRSYDSPYLYVNNCPNTMINPHTGAPDPNGSEQRVFTWTESGSSNTHSICSVACQEDSDCPNSSKSFDQTVPGRCTWGIDSDTGVCMPNITTAFPNIMGRDLPSGGAAAMDYAAMIQLPIIAYILGLVRNYYVVGEGDRVDNTVSQARAQYQVREILFGGAYDQEVRLLDNFIAKYGSILYPNFVYHGTSNMSVNIISFLHEFGLNWSMTHPTAANPKHNNFNVCPFGSVMTTSQAELPNTCFLTSNPTAEVPPQCRKNTQDTCQAEADCTWGVNRTADLCVHQPQRCANVKKAHAPFLDPLCPYLPAGVHACEIGKTACDGVNCNIIAVDQCYPSMEQNQSKGCCYLEPIL